MNSSFVLLLLIAIATLQVNAFLPSSLKASSIFKQLSTRLQFKNFDEMLEQLEVPVLVDFYGDYSLWRSHRTVNVEVHLEMISFTLRTRNHFISYVSEQLATLSNMRRCFIHEAQWCGPCQMMQPILEDVANRLENDAKVAKVDTDKAPKLGHRYQVTSTHMHLQLYSSLSFEV